AEDGIRDRNVTGVQTCALPICVGVHGSIPPPARPPPEYCRAHRRLRRPTNPPHTVRAHPPDSDRPTAPPPPTNRPQHAPAQTHRSEERRVGKEGRTRREATRWR